VDRAAQRGGHGRVVDSQLADGHVGDRQVKAVARQLDRLKADPAVQRQVGVEVAQDAGRDRVEIDGGDRCTGAQLRWHRRDKVADPERVRLFPPGRRGARPGGLLRKEAPVTTLIAVGRYRPVAGGVPAIGADHRDHRNASDRPAGVVDGHQADVPARQDVAAASPHGVNEGGAGDNCALLQYRSGRHIAPVAKREPMSETHILEDSHLRSTDSQPIRSASLSDINIDRVISHIAQATMRGRYSGTRDPLEYLKHQRCVATIDGELHATPTGILCFGHNPQEIFPHAVVDIGHYSGGEPISYEVMHIEKGLGGTLLDQIDRVESFLWTNTLHGMTIGDGARRVEINEYPRVVLRELVVNMVVHRDYTNQHSTARVQKLRDRIEWISPGGLPPGVTIENLLVAQSSRNPAIARVLYEIGMVEAFGQGLDTVVRELQIEEMQRARFDDLSGFFQVTVWGKPTSRFTEIASVSRLNDRQRRILSFIRAHGWSTPRDIAGLFDAHITQRSIQRDLKELIAAGLVSQDGKGRAVRYQVQE